MGIRAITAMLCTASLLACGTLHALTLRPEPQVRMAAAGNPEGVPEADSTLWQRFEHAVESGAHLHPSEHYLSGWELDRSEFIAPQHNTISYVVAPKMPSHVDVTGFYRISRRWGITLTNGKAIHWGIYPSSYLDARTLSFPVPK